MGRGLNPPNPPPPSGYATVEEYDHSTSNLFDNLVIVSGDRIPSWAMGLESIFNGNFSFVGGLLRRSQGFLPCTRGSRNVKICGWSPPFGEI